MPNGWLNVPLFPQEFEYSCVAACVRMVLAHYGDLRSEADLRSLLDNRHPRRQYHVDFRARFRSLSSSVEHCRIAKGVGRESTPHRADANRLIGILEHGHL